MEGSRVRSISFATNFLDDKCALGPQHPYKSITTSIKINVLDRSFSTECHRRKYSRQGDIVDIKSLDFKLKNLEDFSKIKQFIEHASKKNIGDYESLRIEVDSASCSKIAYLVPIGGTMKEEPKVVEQCSDFNEIEIIINPKNSMLTFSGICQTGIILPFFKKQVNYIPQDNENIEEFKQFLEDTLSSFNENTKKKIENILTDEITGKLEETKWGHEVIKHIRDGDNCFQIGLIFPALGSYIHAIEWAIIAYLESQHKKDIIKEETNGNKYYFSTLAEELQKHTCIDQKTISRLKEINESERRWMAHHKSGEVLEEEVSSTRARLAHLLNNLFLNRN